MTGEYISRAALLLQYYSALGELMEEGRRAQVPAPPVRGEHAPEAFELHQAGSRVAAL